MLYIIFTVALGLHIATSESHRGDLLLWLATVHVHVCVEEGESTLELQSILCRVGDPKTNNFPLQ